MKKYSGKTKWLFSLLTLGFILLLCLLVMEVGGRALFSGRDGGSPYSLFYQRESQSVQPRSFLFSFTDPLLGWGRSPAFKEYFSDDVPSEERVKGFEVGQSLRGVKRVVGLGGSTTDHNVQPRNWMYYLAEGCTERREKCQSLNGGIMGYSTTQDFLKLVRDVIPLKPDLVISLSGVNDFSLNALTGRTFVNTHHAEIESALRKNEWEAHSPLHNPPNLLGVLPNARFLAEFLGFHLWPPPLPPVVPIGTVDNYSKAYRWELNVRKMHAVSKEMGFSFFVFLQPFLALEPDLLNQMIQMRNTKFYFDQAEVQKFYVSARAACKKMSYCADLSEGFYGKLERWGDPIHLDPEGHEWEAKRMMEILRARGVWKSLEIAP